MRLWHISLIREGLLPDSQLKGQWRECNLILKDILEGKQTNHILINYIWEYQLSEFVSYCWVVEYNMRDRGFRTNDKLLKQAISKFGLVYYNDLFPKHHTYRYLKQCFYNLQEKYDRRQKDFDADRYAALERFVLEEWMA